jgi:hypothetical protein
MGGGVEGSRRILSYNNLRCQSRNGFARATLWRPIASLGLSRDASDRPAVSGLNP